MIRKAFTMLELVFVIVILGIVASIGADIISSLYENYIKTRAINRLQAQSELVLDQIAKRLQYRIKPSTIARKDNGNINDFVSLTNADEDYDILEWIGKDYESFKGDYNGTAYVPGWSGLIDFDSNETERNIAGNNWLKSTGSRLDYASKIMRAISNNEVDINGSVATIDRPAIIFKGQSSFDIINDYGWNGTAGIQTHRVVYPNDTKTDVLEFVDAPPVEIYEQYDLVSSAYAIAAVPVNAANNDYNLTLFYNYQPWEGERYDDTNTSRQVLMSNVSTFRFRQVGETIRVKLCVHDDNSTAIDLDFAFCKERVIY